MVQIDYSRDSLLTRFALETLKDRYLLPGETPQDGFARAASAYADDEDHAQRLYDYASNLWFMFSTPILSNGGTERGLGISCYLNHIDDSRNGIIEHWKENTFLASLGGGVGACWGDIRSDGTGTSSGSVSTGSIPFLKTVDSQFLAVAQGKTRRGSYAAYQNIDHPEIEEFITIRKTTGGDSNRKCPNIHNAVNITDEFMESVIAGRDWNLIDPHSKKVTKTLKARDLFRLILETRISKGEPYIHFIDTANKHLPESLKVLGLRINTSNLCQEVELPTSKDRTAVCCLSSVNLEKYDEWKDHLTFISDLIKMLDNVIENFIQTAPPELWRAVASAKGERSLGLGAMGFHSYLQKLNIPFEGPLASGINRKIFSQLKAQATEASKELYNKKGPAGDLRNERNAHLMAIAPNASSSIICGEASPSIEPFRANAYTHKTLSGSFYIKNKYLQQRLEELGKNTDETWTSIIGNGGSVTHLEFLSDWDKEVFKTAIEIDQHWIIQHAADRQEYICQGQSINLFFLANTNVQYLYDVHIAAYKKGIKGLYYLKSESIQRPDLISQQIERITRKETEEDCFSCQG
jgi:ribonucleoside-diphosphate reductase alpha chain